MGHRGYMTYVGYISMADKLGITSGWCNGFGGVRTVATNLHVLNPKSKP